MTRNIQVAVTLVAGAMSAACSVERAQAVTLKTGAAQVCHGESLLVSSLPDGRFSLGYAAFDSAQLVQALGTVLGLREEKLVMVRLDAKRQAPLRWIVPASEANGGVAYEADDACLSPAFSIRTVVR